MTVPALTLLVVAAVLLGVAAHLLLRIPSLVVTTASASDRPQPDAQNVSGSPRFPSTS